MWRLSSRPTMVTAGRIGMMGRGCHGVTPVRWFATGQSAPPTGTLSFQGYRFIPEIKAFLTQKEIETPSPIQQLSFNYFLTASKRSQKVPVFLGGPTGSGKTLAYLLPVLDHLKRLEKDEGMFGMLPNRPSVIILAPSKELVKNTRLPTGS